VNPIIQESYECNPQTAGHKIGTLRDTAITSKNQLRTSKSPPNNRVGTQSLMPRTPFLSFRESTSGDRGIIITTEPDLTIGERGKPSFTDGQQDSQSTSMERQPGDSVQDKSYAEPTPHAVSLALPFTGETSREEAHRSMVSTPVPETPQGDLCVIREHIVQPTPKKKRAFSHRTKTGCITVATEKRNAMSKNHHVCRPFCTLSQ
jgi:hypothetical protein